MCILFCRWRDFRCYVVMKNYITIQEITDIYKISQSVVNIILEKYKIDSYKGKKWLLINFKDFHKAYTSAYNPSLFSELDKKVKQIPRKPEEVEELLKFWDTNWMFFKVFCKPDKNTMSKKCVNNNLFV